MAELDLLGLGDWVRSRGRNRGLRAAGFGQELLLPWPGGSLPDHGGAVPRTELDARIRQVALDAGVVPLEGARAVDVERDGALVRGVAFDLGDGHRRTVACRRLVVADGARSPLGRVLGREWHRDTAYGVAVRGYVRSGRSDDEWISSHLELRGADGELLSGYGWVFPLGAAGDGGGDIGVRTPAPARRRGGAGGELLPGWGGFSPLGAGGRGGVNWGVGPLPPPGGRGGVQPGPLLAASGAARHEEWQLDGPVRVPASALLPMGGA